MNTDRFRQFDLATERQFKETVHRNIPDVFNMYAGFPKGSYNKQNLNTLYVR